MERKVYDEAEPILKLVEETLTKNKDHLFTQLEIQTQKQAEQDILLSNCQTAFEEFTIREEQYQLQIEGQNNYIKSQAEIISTQVGKLAIQTDKMKEVNAKIEEVEAKMSSNIPLQTSQLAHKICAKNMEQIASCVKHALNTVIKVQDVPKFKQAEMQKQMQR